MKQMLLLMVIIFIAAFGTAAETDDSSIKLARSAVEAERREMVAANLDLADTHREIFWPLYLEYRAAINTINDDKVRFYQRFFSSYETLSDDEAIALLDGHLEIKRRYLDVQKKFSQKMQAALPGRIVARFFQIENKMDIIVDYEMTGEFPLIK